MDDLEIDDILAQKRKKGVNSGRKGKRVERELAKLLNARFGGGFSRSIGSGNRWGQVANLPEHAQQTFSGDLVCPPAFAFVIESKGGYDDIDLNSVFIGGNAELDNFLKQADDESKRTGRKPLLVWKKNRKPWVVFLKSTDLPSCDYSYRLYYREWVAIALEELLKMEDSYFYKK